MCIKLSFATQDSHSLGFSHQQREQRRSQQQADSTDPERHGLAVMADQQPSTVGRAHIAQALEDVDLAEVHRVVLWRAEFEQQGIQTHGDLIQRPTEQHSAEQDQPLIAETLNESGHRAQQQTGKNAITGVALPGRAAPPPQRHHGHSAG